MSDVSWSGILDRVKIITLGRKMYLCDLKIYYEKGIKPKISERKYNFEIKYEIPTLRLQKIKVVKKKRER
jgi:hypothetical protein